MRTSTQDLGPSKPQDIDTIAVTYKLTPASETKLRSLVKTVHYYPSGDIPLSLLPSIQAWFTNWTGFPPHVKDVSQIPNLKHLQTSTAGVDQVLTTCLPITKCLGQGKEPDFTLGNASGIHVDSIPQYVVGTLMMILNGLGRQVVYAKVSS